MANKKLEIGSCAWLEGNRHLPGVQGIYAKQIEACDAAKHAREEARRQRLAAARAERENAVLEEATVPATGPSRPRTRP